MANRLNKIFNCIKSISNIKNVYRLENQFNRQELTNAVILRRKWYETNYGMRFDKIPYDDPHCKQMYSKSLGKNCENIVGYSPIPMGLVGPLKVDSKQHFVPIATTEGALVASINRGCKVINEASDVGIKTLVKDVGMTRAPLVEFNNIDEMYQCQRWMEDSFDEIKEVFENTTNYGKLQGINFSNSGSKLHMKFFATTGDAMGMNMVTKGCDEVLEYVKIKYPQMEVLSLSGNCCVDKKPSAMNWIHGRGKHVTCEIDLEIPKVESILKTDVNKLVKLNTEKNLVGSALSGSMGGYNANIANVVSGIYVATGQDIAQIGTSSVGLTNYQVKNDKLNVELTMPSIEVGTVGGGTDLPSQKECLRVMDIDNSLPAGENSKKLSKLVASTALAGELSLMGALANGDLMKAHIKLNRKQ